MGVVCIKVMAEGKGGDESAEGGSVHDEKQRTKNGALGDATGAVSYTHLTLPTILRV